MTLSGSRRAAMTVNVRARCMVYLTGEWNDVKLRGLRVGVCRAIAETQFTPFVTLVNNLQFDTVSRVAGWQSRFR
jgi:hypothetical protein